MVYKVAPKPMTPEQIKAYRTKHNMTQAELAEALTVTLRTVENYEQGARAIPLHVGNTLNLIAKLRKVSD